MFKYIHSHLCLYFLWSLSLVSNTCSASNTGSVQHKVQDNQLRLRRGPARSDEDGEFLNIRLSVHFI